MYNSWVEIFVCFVSPQQQKVVAKAVAVEEKKLKEEMRVKRGLDHMFPKAADAPTQVRVWLFVDLLSDFYSEVIGRSLMVRVHFINTGNVHARDVSWSVR